ncbi:MAG: hypothetical protein WC992_05660 [Acholeplasmataceae bacterium]|jgi:hypothetical protein|nr:hypothetical protein [Acholeplasmataceae bacterium]
MKNRIIAVTPLISLMLFLFFGLYMDNWSLGASFFFLIPISWVLFSQHPFRRLSDIMPLVALAVFLWIGFGFKVWHPTWLVFLSIPLVNLIVERKIDARKMVTILVIISYIVFGLISTVWHPTWIMLLLIPIINTLFFPRKSSIIYADRSLRSRIRHYVIDEEKDEQ